MYGNKIVTLKNNDLYIFYKIAVIIFTMHACIVLLGLARNIMAGEELSYTK